MYFDLVKFIKTCNQNGKTATKTLNGSPTGVKVNISSFKNGYLMFYKNKGK